MKAAAGQWCSARSGSSSWTRSRTAHLATGRGTSSEPSRPASPGRLGAADPRCHSARTHFALTFRDKSNLLDLSSGAKIRWTTKTSSFHGIRPVIKLTDGMKLDPMRVVTLGSPRPFNQIWVTPDLSKVDEVGFADLTHTLRCRAETLLRHDDRRGLVRMERAAIVVCAGGVEGDLVAVVTVGACRCDASGIEHAWVRGAMGDHVRVQPVH
jgi:hypothetical protein